MRSAHRSNGMIVGFAGLLVGLCLAWVIVSVGESSASSLPTRGALGTARPASLIVGRQLVMVIIGSSQCGASRGTTVASAIDLARAKLRTIAQRRGVSFASIGVAVDENAATGIEWLRGIGGFDEVAAGPRMLNSAVSEYIWNMPNSMGATPQIVVVLRTTEARGYSHFRVASNDVLLRMIGPADIMSWQRLGDVDSLLTTSVNRADNSIH